MRILIVGGRSSLAQVLRRELAQTAEVWTAGRKECDVDLDLEWNFGRMSLPHKFDVIVNAAAHFGGKKFRDVFAAEKVNVLGALKLCRLALKGGVKHFVQISSTSAYSCVNSAYYGSYSVSKRHGDEIVALYCAQEKIRSTILRPSQLYCALDQFRRHQPFLYSTLDKAIGNEDIVIYGNRDALRNYLHAEDFCRTIHSVIIQGAAGLYPCTHPDNTSLVALAKIIIAAAGSRSRVIFNRTMEDIPDNVVPYTNELYERTNTHPSISLIDGISNMIATRLASL